MSSKFETLLPEEHRTLVLEFLAVFSRFEYALKRAGFISGPNTNVEAQWDGFGSAYAPSFDLSISPELQEACAYYKAHPPRKQIRNGSVLGWSEPSLHTNEPFLTWLLLAVRRVRNNLFHGGKFPFAPVAEPSRDPTLLRHALTILDACLPLDSKVRDHFTRE